MLRIFKYRWQLLCVGLASSTACASAFQVTSGGDKPDGLPFYLKSMVYRQHSVYEYTWLRISLSQAPILPAVTPPGPEQTGARTTMTRDVIDDAANRVEIAKLQAMVARIPGVNLANLAGAIDAIHAQFASIPQLPATHFHSPGAGALRLAGNFVDRVSVVDYTKTYYLNGEIPPFGSNSISAELGADGTLSKGASTSTGGVGEAIGAVAAAVTGIAPIKEFLTSKWVPAKKEVEEATKSGQVSMLTRGLGDHQTMSFRIEIGVESRSMVYDFTKDTLSRPDGTQIARVPADFTKGLFTSRPADQPVAEKSADDAISFAGKVQLPKAKTP